MTDTTTATGRHTSARRGTPRPDRSAMRAAIVLILTVAAGCTAATLFTLVILGRAARTQVEPARLDVRPLAERLAADPTFVAAVAREQDIAAHRAAINAWEGTP